MRSLAVSILTRLSINLEVEKTVHFHGCGKNENTRIFGKLKTNLCFVFMQQLRRLAWALALATRQCTKKHTFACTFLAKLYK